MKRRIIAHLVESETPQIAYHIAIALKKQQSHIQYHLDQLIQQGRVICYETDEGRKYTCQFLLISEDAKNDFYEMIIDFMPTLIPYMDLSQAESMTTAFINTLQDFLCISVARDVSKQLKNIH
jgi:hypothetical protein